MRCNECGAALVGEERFCGSCGGVVPDLRPMQETKLMSIPGRNVISPAVESVARSARACTRCGKSLREDERMCDACGLIVEEPRVEAPVDLGVEPEPIKPAPEEQHTAAYDVVASLALAADAEEQEQGDARRDPLTCGECGQELNDDARFCSACGAPTPSVPAALLDETVVAGAVDSPPPVGSEPGGELPPPPPPPAAAAPAVPPPPPAAAAAAVMPPLPPPPPPGAKAGGMPPPGTSSGLPAVAVSPAWRSGLMVGHIPLELAAVVALFALPGAYFLWIALKALPDSLRLVSTGYFGHAFGLALLVLLLVVVALGVALLLIARMLYRGSRVGRGLAYVAVASVCSTVLFEDQQSGTAVLIMLASLAAGAVLAFAPAVREIFNSADAPDADQPTSIVVARVCVVIWAALLAVIALAYLLLGGIDGKYVFYGLVSAAVSVTAFNLYRRLSTPDRTARKIATGAAGVAAIFMLLGPGNGGIVVGLGLTLAIPIALWMPADARRFYGDEGEFIKRAPQ